MNLVKTAHAAMTGPLNTNQQAVVAGGGPVGALTAIALAQQGWQVQVPSSDRVLDHSLCVISDLERFVFGTRTHCDSDHP